MNDKDYIEQEVKLRVQEQLNDARFKMVDERFSELRNSIDNVVNYILGIYGIIGAASLSILINFLWHK
jgi:hypothetical protein